MINVAKKITTSGDNIIYTATEEGVMQELSIVNEDASKGTINVYRTGVPGSELDGINVKLTQTLELEIGEAAFVDRKVIKAGQIILINTDVNIDVDLNIY